MSWIPLWRSGRWGEELTESLVFPDHLPLQAQSRERFCSKSFMFLQGWAISDFLGSNGYSPNCNIVCFSRRFASAEANPLIGSYFFHRNRLFLQTICSRGHKPLCRLGALLHTIVYFHRRFWKTEKYQSGIENGLWLCRVLEFAPVLKKQRPAEIVKSLGMENGSAIWTIWGPPKWLNNRKSFSNLEKSLNDLKKI